MDKVKDFYKDTPFNFSQDTELYIESIKNSNQILEYIDLHKYLNNNFFNFNKYSINSVIEFGCGTGWLTNTISYYYKKEVKAIDFTEKAIKKAEEVSRKLKSKAEFVLSDIFNYEDNKRYDLVISMGVLHHTYDCKKAFDKISNFVKPGGLLYVGLYHLYGRKPMLKMLQSYAFWNGNEAAYNLFKMMNKDMKNNQHNFSWFRDQVLHPHETQHTYEEVSKWYDSNSFDVISTSINNYKNFNKYKEKEIYELEKKLENYSFGQNFESLKFTPGYFTICGRKKFE